MAAPILARSLSRVVWERLPAQPAPGRVLAVFERACLLSSEGGELLSLVLPGISDGPLNVVIDGQPGAFRAVQAGTPASLGRGGLWLGGLEVVLSAASIWEPRPCWDQLRARAMACSGWSLGLREMALQHAPGGSLLAFLAGRGEAWPPSGRWQEACAALRAGWAGDAGAVHGAALRLAGLGGGLTPAGDDFLAGLTLRAWLQHPSPHVFCSLLAEAAAPHTTVLSGALLQAAARGECSASWHALLWALGSGGQGALAGPALDVLAHGHTSGADMLAGFLWIPA